MMAMRTWKGVVVVLCALVLSAQCDQVPECPTETFPPEITKWEADYQELLDKECFDALLSDDKIAHTVDCDSSYCTTQVPVVAAEYLQLKIKYEACMKPEWDRVSYLENAVLDMCNECTESYAVMEKQSTTLTSKSCVPTAASYSCTPECIEQVNKYTGMWSHLLEGGVCRPHMPGGCGNGGGLSEDGVYTTLVGLSPTITSYSTLVPACEATCMSAYDGWYKNWQRAIDDGCIAVTGEGVDFVANEGRSAFSVFETVTPTCSEKCMHRINDRLIRTFYVIPVNCRTAGPQSHFHQLRIATGVHACAEDISHQSYGAMLSFNMVANVVIVLSMFSASLLALYCVAASFKNYFVRGNRGMDVLPNPLDWKRFVVAPTAPGEVQLQTRAQPRSDDEEKLMGPGASE